MSDWFGVASDRRPADLGQEPLDVVAMAGARRRVAQEGGQILPLVHEDANVAARRSQFQRVVQRREGLGGCCRAALCASAVRI